MEYQNLGKSGLKISKIILGAMSYGHPDWAQWVLDEKASLPLIKAAYDAGINTWDTANIYSNGWSEKVLAKAIADYKIPRNRIVILSKCFGGVGEEPSDRSGSLTAKGWENRIGLSRRAIFDAVDASVERLGTYIDLLQIHRYDPYTPPEETMEALHDIIKTGKVRYIGASSMWTWQFQEMQNIAEKRGWTKFISMQNYYNLIYREEEREMIPYCNHTGVGVIPWSPIARGVLARPYTDQTSLRATTDQFTHMLVGQYRDTDIGKIDKKITDRVEEIAKKHGVSMTNIATAWVLSKGCAPIIGLNKTERIDEAVKAVSFKIPEEDIKYLEEAYYPKPNQGFT